MELLIPGIDSWPVFLGVLGGGWVWLGQCWYEGAAWVTV